MIREVDTSKITEAIRDMCIAANYGLQDDMRQRLDQAKNTEQNPLGRQILEQLEKNLAIAKEDQVPICQDTGMATVFLESGQDVHFTGGDLTDAVNEGVRGLGPAASREYEG